ncbi:uncharacterized protein LOC134842646 [Symsagittifera roscoffensis]|uniref:uncharacterized protein LOC134842646 n=1 Tax=Symsagittifera roscoffensis TaxID=84072 RepID=UPI00307C3E32
MSSTAAPPVAKSISDVTEEIVKNATTGYEPGSYQYMAVEKMTRLSIYAFTEPWEFLLNLLLVLTPLMAVAAFCAYRLSKSSHKKGKKSAARPNSTSSSSSGKPERQMPPRAAKKSKKDN